MLDGGAWPVARGGTEVHGADVARATWLLLTAPDVAGQVYNCSDIYVTTRDVAEIVQRLTATGARLPDPPGTPPSNVMDAGRLRARGLEFGGWPCLERTVVELVAAARRHGH
jgi:nucleoside-diphosphate-sugar epimerase